MLASDVLCCSILQNTASDVSQAASDKSIEVTEGAKQLFSQVNDTAGETVDNAKDAAGGAIDTAKEKAGEAKDGVSKALGTTKKKASDATAVSLWCERPVCTSGHMCIYWISASSYDLCSVLGRRRPVCDVEYWV